jgi:hypothetical protein
VSNITNIHKGFSSCHQYAKRFLRYLLQFSGETMHLRTEGDSIRNVVFVLNIGDKEKSPCECWLYYSHFFLLFDILYVKIHKVQSVCVCVVL